MKALLNMPTWRDLEILKKMGCEMNVKHIPETEFIYVVLLLA